MSRAAAIQLLSERSQRARAAFLARMDELGGTLLDTEWRGVEVRYRARCAQGHDVTAHPALLRRGQGFCRICAGRDSAAAWQAFRGRVAELGGTVVEPNWLGADVPHRIRCGAGHESTPRPNAVVSGGKGICRTCVGQESKVAEAAFRALVEELGGTVLEADWLGRRIPHRVRCPDGHEVAIRPKHLKRALCRMCSRRDPKAADAAFRSYVGDLGGTVLEAKWLGSHTKHRVRCAEGHEGTVIPGNGMRGGICRSCASKYWDVFYVVTDDVEDHLKFGVTSRDGRRRLKQHADDGFTTVVRLLTQFPDAYQLECDVKATLRLAGEKPVRGREYFHVRALSTVLDIVDHYPVKAIIPAQPPTALRKAIPRQRPAALRKASTGQPGRIGRKRLLTPAQATEAQQMYDARLPVREIAEHFGIGRSTLYGYLDRNRGRDKKPRARPGGSL